MHRTPACRSSNGAGISDEGFQTVEEATRTAYDGYLRFIHSRVHKAAVSLNRSTLPGQADLVPER